MKSSTFAEKAIKTDANSRLKSNPAHSQRPATMHVCGLNHTRAPLEVRERFALCTDQCRALLTQLRDDRIADQALVVSTCNRTELYVWGHSRGLDAKLREAFLAIGDLIEGADSPPPLYQLQGMEAIRHLFAVTSGLDSMILGENQIKQQLKLAYAMSQEEECAGIELHRTMKAAFEAGKRIRSETALNEGTLCVGKAAVLHAEKLLDGIKGRSVLIIGAGKIARTAAAALSERRPGRLWIVNRTEANARDIVEKLGGETYGLEALPCLLPEADFVLGAAWAPDLLLSREQFEAARRQAGCEHPMVMIDVAVPRILDTAIGELPGIHLSNIGEMQEVVDDNRQRRSREVTRAWAIIEEEVEKYSARIVSQMLGRRIRKLDQAIDAILEEEMTTTCAAEDAEEKKTAAQDAQHLALKRRRIRQRLMHEVIQDMKENLVIA